MAAARGETRMELEDHIENLQRLVDSARDTLWAANDPANESTRTGRLRVVLSNLKGLQIEAVVAATNLEAALSAVEI
jgi:hypothetical protein